MKIYSADFHGINYLTGSISPQGSVTNYTGSFKGNLDGTASYAEHAVTSSYLLGTISSASYALNAETASYFDGFIESSSYSSYAISSSYSVSSSFSNKASLSDSSTTSSHALISNTASYYGGSVVSSSYALTASYALNGGSGGGSSVSSSYSSTASYANYSVTASYLDGQFFATYEQTSSAMTWSFSHGLNNRYPVITIWDYDHEVIIPEKIYASSLNTTEIYFAYPLTGFATATVGSIIPIGTSSFAVSSSHALSSSFSNKASLADSSTTSSHALIANTASYYGGTVISSSYSVSSSFSNKASLSDSATTSSHSLIANTASYYGGTVISSSYATTSSFSNKSSLADSSTTSSHALISNTASYYGGNVVSSSYALTASYALNGGSGGSATYSLIGSNLITGSVNNFNPTGWSTATSVKIASDDIHGITSFASRSAGTEIVLINTGSNPIYIPGDHTDGEVFNRVKLTNDHILYPKNSVRLIYDGDAMKWYISAAADSMINQTYKTLQYFYSPGTFTAGDWGILNLITINGGGLGNYNGSGVLPAANTLTTGVSSSGGAHAGFTKSGPYVYSSVGHAHLTSTWFISFPNLSDSTDSYEAQFSISGFLTSVSKDDSNTVGIRYTHASASGNFQGFTKASGVQNNVDLGVTVVANTPYMLTVELNQRSTEARFYINGDFCGKLTGGAMPATNTMIGSKAVIIKSSGTTSRSLYIHSMYSRAVYNDDLA